MRWAPARLLTPNSSLLTPNSSPLTPYLVGHNATQGERYTALRDVIARNARDLARKTLRHDPWSRHHPGR
ncbi:hypothetical protein [Candidatus Thiodictyon syntrophicum]|uniref:hypothetical protein n=1 Tax=Candidatus Thiodictyon syntrophicum TaxID=1166950 RepID=UPI0015621C50|nr:hypothetical protein [Candidatus Thiodictyon syntrophicum]